MSTSDIERSGGTPSPSRDGQKLRDRIAKALTPEVRDRPQWDGKMRWNAPETQGDVLDTAPTDCTYWSWWWSKGKGEIGFSRRACGKRSCSSCAPGHLADRVVMALEVWGTRALRAEYPSHRSWQRAREKRGLRIRGAQATPGLLIIRHGDRVVVWAPLEVALDGAVLVSGQRLRRQLVADLRAIPYPEQDPPTQVWVMASARLAPHTTSSGLRGALRRPVFH
jgi:hypothetical protein